jgi:hypothetical protein
VALGVWGSTEPFNFCTLAPTTGVDQIWLREFLSASLGTLDENGEWVPDLAEGWEVSDDGIVWTFYLRDDVTWHDGEGFFARDVEFTLGLMTSEAFPHYAAIFGDVIEDVEPIDDFTVELQMQRPIPLDGIGTQSVFANLVSWNPVPAHLLADIPPEEICFTDWAQSNYVGLGPFAVIDSSPDSYVIYEPYDGYYGEPSELRELGVRFSSEPEVLFAMLANGELDMAQITPRLIEQVNNIDYLEMAPDASLIAVNTDRIAWPPVDPHLHQALTNPPGKSSVPFRQLLGEQPIGDAFLLPQQGETGAAIAALGEVLGSARINQARSVTIEDAGETVHWAPIGPEGAPMPADANDFWNIVQENGELVVGIVTIERDRDAVELIVEPAAAFATFVQDDVPVIELRDQSGEVLELFASPVLTYGDNTDPVEIPEASIDLGTRWCQARILGCWIKYPCGW